MHDPQRSEPKSAAGLALVLTAGVAAMAGLAALGLRTGIDHWPLAQALARQVRDAGDAALVLASLIIVFAVFFRQFQLSRAEGVTAGLARRPPLVLALAVLAWVAALPLLAVLVAGRYEAVENEHQARLRAAEDWARMLARRVDARLDSGLAIIGTLAAQPRVRSLVASDCDPLLNELVKAWPPFSGPVTRNADGQVVCTAKDRRPWTPDPTYLKRLAAGQPFVHLVPAPLRQAFLVHPLRAPDGALVGALDVEIDLDALSALVITALPAAAQGALVAADGRLLGGNGEAASRPGAISPREATGAEPLPPAARDAVASWERAGYAYASAPLARLRAQTLVRLDASVEASGYYDWPWLLAAFALSLFAVQIAHRAFARPSRSLRTTAQALLAGQAERRMAVVGSAEAAAAAEAFNAYADGCAEQAAERQRTEDGLRDALFLWADWIWVLDAQLRVERVDCAPRVSPALRARLQALKGHTLWDAEPERTPQAEIQHARTALQDRQALRDWRLGFAAEEGQVADTLWSGLPRHDAAGAFVGYQGVGRDITQTLRDSEVARRFESAVAQTSDPVLLVERAAGDAADRILYANRAAALLFDYPEAALAGRPLESLLATADPGHDELVQALGAGQPLHRRLNVMRRRGQTQVVDVRVDLLLDSRMGHRRFVVIMRDLTADVDRARQVVEAHEELKQAMRQRSHELEVMAKELESFSYTVSHDLRAPLRVVEGFARILVEDYGRLLDKMAHDHLQRIIQAAARMNSMINALLDLSRLSSQPIVREPLSLSRMAEEVIEELRAGSPGREVDPIIAPDALTEGDRTLLRIVLDNLIGNAWKYTARVRVAEIEFGVRMQGGVPVYFVRDNGAGFDMRFADRLFGVFQRLHSAADFPGTGVGLATVQRIIRRHGGRIWAESEPGHGSTFYFTLWERAAPGE